MYYWISNLNIQFNSVYYNENIKTDIDLDKEIRLFIKVVMLSDFSPKDVLVDLELMSGDIEEYETNLQKRRESILEIEKKIRNHDFESDEEYFLELKNLENKIKELDHFRTSTHIGKKIKSIENNKDSFISHIHSNKSYEIYMSGLINGLKFVLNHI